MAVSFGLPDTKRLVDFEATSWLRSRDDHRSVWPKTKEKNYVQLAFRLPHWDLFPGCHVGGSAAKLLEARADLFPWRRLGPEGNQATRPVTPGLLTEVELVVPLDLRVAEHLVHPLFLAGQ